MNDPDWCGPVKPNKSQEQKGHHASLVELPHIGEVVQTKGDNYKTLKEWKAEHGSGNRRGLADQVSCFEYKRAGDGPFLGS